MIKWVSKTVGVKGHVPKMPNPRLVSIDLDKRKGCEHPDINDKNFYLVLYDGCFYAGRVSKEWYGWNLDVSYDAGVQLDDTHIQAIWKIIPKQELKKTKIIIRCEDEKCKGVLVYLKTRRGDPEGIRADTWCPKCHTIWGCTKARRYKIGTSTKMPIDEDIY